MKMIRSSNCSGWIVFFVIALLDHTKQQQCCVPWEIFPLELDFSVNTIQFTMFMGLRQQLNFSFQASIDCGYSSILTRQSTESETTYPLAFDSLTALSFNKAVLINVFVLQSIVDIQNIYNHCDPEYFFVKYRTSVSSFRSPCSWLYENVLGNLVQDVSLFSLLRTQKHPLDHRVDVDL